MSSVPEAQVNYTIKTASPATSLSGEAEESYPDMLRNVAFRSQDYNPSMKSSLRLNARVLPLVGAAGLIMQIIDPSRVWVILLVGLGGAWLVCRWWVRGLSRALRLERELRYGWAQVGDRLEERFTLTNQFHLPATWVTVHDHSTLPGHKASAAIGVDGASTSQWRTLTQCTRRGVYTLGGTTLETGDPLGIYTLTLEDPASQTLAVMPPVLPLPKFQIAASGWAGDGKSSRRAFEETIHASHTRAMAPNDPLRLIHWKTTAHRDEFFVRQFDGAPAGDWWIVLDLYQDSQVGTGWDSTEEHSVILASSLAALGLDEGHPVGLAVNGGEPGWLPPRRNEHQLRSLLKALAVASPCALHLKDYLQRAGGSLGSHCSLLVITACTDLEWSESLLPLVWRGIRPTVFLLDPLTFGGSATTAALSGRLQYMGVPCHVIPKELLDKPQARPGHEGEWEWRVSGTGKAIPIRAPRDEHSEWRRMR